MLNIQVDFKYLCEWFLVLWSNILNLSPVRETFHSLLVHRLGDKFTLRPNNVPGTEEIVLCKTNCANEKKWESVITIRRYVIVTNCDVLSYAFTWCRLHGDCITISFVAVFSLRFHCITFYIKCKEIDIMAVRLRFFACVLRYTSSHPTFFIYYIRFWYTTRESIFCYNKYHPNYLKSVCVCVHEHNVTASK